MFFDLRFSLSVLVRLALGFGVGRSGDFVHSLSFFQIFSFLVLVLVSLVHVAFPGQQLLLAPS